MSTGMSSKRSFANISDSPVVDSCNRAPFVASPIKRHKPDIPLMPPQSQQQNTIQSHFPDAKVIFYYGKMINSVIIFIIRYLFINL
jgi:hypothetical protein